MAPSEKSTLVIGIDFGTTYSGVSWMICMTDGVPGRPEVVTNWPIPGGCLDRHKVPSEIYYDKATSKAHWGYGIPPGLEPLKWFKLLLLEPEDMQVHIRQSPQIKTARRMMDEAEKTVVEVIGDYLKKLWEHSLIMITKAKGRLLVEGTPIHVVITVPAIWKEYARDTMRQAAKLAGLLEDRPCGETTLSFISEPEAAALATIPDYGSRGDLGVGDSFIVCDCGGGTVDVISYVIRQLEPLEISECVEGDGALCGATFLDEDFKAHMRKTLGVTAWDNMEPRAMKKMINDSWEHGIKKNFDGGDAGWTVELPRNWEQAEVFLTGSEVRQIFEGVLTEIYKLVNNQISDIQEKTLSSPKLVQLVGGFGRCSFIHTWLRERCDDEIEVLQTQGNDPWAAICRGAVLSGATGRTANDDEVQIRSRIARFSYGWTYSTPFDQSIHDHSDRRFDKLRRRHMACNQIAWAVKKGQDVVSKHPSTFPCEKNFPLGTKGFQTGSFKIYACGDDDPPSRLGTQLGTNVQELAKIIYRIPKPIEEYSTIRDGGPAFHSVLLEKKMTISGSALDVAVYVDGKMLARKNLEIQCD